MHGCQLGVVGLDKTNNIVVEIGTILSYPDNDFLWSLQNDCKLISPFTMNGKDIPVDIQKEIFWIQKKYHLTRNIKKTTNRSVFVTHLDLYDISCNVKVFDQLTTGKNLFGSVDRSKGLTRNLFTNCQVIYLTDVHPISRRLSLDNLITIIDLLSSDCILIGKYPKLTHYYLLRENIIFKQVHLVRTKKQISIVDKYIKCNIDLFKQTNTRCFVVVSNSKINLFQPILKDTKRWVCILSN